MDSPLLIPSSPKEVSAEWLTLVLTASGEIAPSVRVIDVDTRELETTAGQTGWYLDLHLQYSVENDTLPNRLFAKLLKPESDLFRDDLVGAFAQELTFYRDINPLTATRVPKFYHGSVSPYDGKAVLLLESLAGASFGTMEAGLDTQDASLILDELASVHGRWWNKSALDGFALSDAFSQVAHKYYQPAVPAIWDRLKTELPELLTARAREVGDRVVNSVPEIWSRLGANNRTLLQLDCRVDNAAFRQQNGARVAVLFDWMVSPGPVGWDLGLLLGTGLTGEALSEIPSLLEHYCGQLERAEVSEFSYQQAHAQLLLGLIAALIGWIFVMGLSWNEVSNIRARDDG